MNGYRLARTAEEARRSKGTNRPHLGFFIALFLSFVVTGIAAQDEETAPELPPGLAPPASEEQGDDGPALPEGLGEETGVEEDSEAPSLPEGLGPEAQVDGKDEGTVDGTTRAGSRSPVRDFVDSLTGFWDIRTGVRVRDDPNQRRLSLAETRLQLSGDVVFGSPVLRVTADLLYDEIADDHELRLEQGRGWLDLRELHVGGPVADPVDVRIGRQILTWGVGDLLFLNDLFPKDWNSFFSGRDVEYLKAPSDAVRASVFLEAFNLDVVYTPKFDPDRYIDNRRLSFFDPRFGRVVGDDVRFDPIRPNDWFDDSEIGLRIYRLLAGWELAAYGYDGFWKSPQGFEPVSGRPLFPELAAWGGSIRGPVGPGILSAETSWYRSLDDLDGTDPFLPNSQLRLLVGYEQEIVPDFTLGGQYYLERTLNHDALVRNLPVGFATPDENRHVLTVRVTLLTHSQNVTWSLFTFASPSDDDGYVRGLWEWKATDAWTWSAGFNLFEGQSGSTFFGQFETNSNVYAALRYGF